MIVSEATSQGVDPSLALSIGHAESGFNPSALSPKGGMGVMQLMPGTAKALGVDPSDVAQNIHGGVKYLKQLSDQFGGDPQLTAAAYNAGPGAVLKHGGVPPYKETQNYVQRVTGRPVVSGGYDASNQDVGPSVDAILKIANQTSAPAATPAPTAASAAQEPSVDDILKAANFTPPAQAAQAKPDTPDMAAARKMVSGGGNFIEGLNTAANGALFGAVPAIQGGLAATATAGRGALHALGLAPAGPFANPGQAYQDVTRAAQEQSQAYAQAHPNASLALSGLGALTGAFAGPGKIALDAAEQGVAHVLPSAIPAVAAKVVPRIAAQAGLGALYGVGEGVSNQDTLGNVAKRAATGAVVQGGLGAAGEAAAPLLRTVPTTAGRTLVGAGVGGALGSLVGYPVAGALALAGVGAGTEGLSPLTDAARVKAAPEALSTLPDADIAKMQNAPEGALAGEALDAKGEKIVARAATENPGLADRIQAAVDTRDIQAPERISGQIAQATGIAPETATADVQSQVDALRNGPAASAYAKALTGKGVWSDDIAEQFKSPAVQKAYGNAKYELSTLGKDAEVPNPNYTPQQTQTGALKVDPEVYRQWQAEGSNDPARLAEMQNATVNAGQPRMVPTDEALDLTHRYLRDGFNMMEPASRRVATIASNAFKGAIDDAIPGLADARAKAGDYLSYQDAYEKGSSLMGNGKTAETEQAFSKRFDGLTPAEQQATKYGFMADLYRQINGANFNPNTILKSPKIHGVMSKMLTPDQMAAVNRALRQHAALKAASGRLVKAATPKSGGEGIMEGAIIGGADHPSITGVVGGALSGLGTKAAKSAFAKGLTTKVGRSALAHLMAEDARTVGQAAASAKSAKAARAATKSLSQVTLRSALAGANGLGVGR